MGFYNYLLNTKFPFKYKLLTILNKNSILTCQFTIINISQTFPLSAQLLIFQFLVHWYINYIQNHHYSNKNSQNQKGIEQKIKENIKKSKQMSKALFELQNNIKNLRQQLNDRIHLAYLNHQSYLCLKSSSNQPFREISSNLPNKSENQLECDLKTNNQLQEPSAIDQTQNTLQVNRLIQKKLRNLSQIFEKRSQNHLNYLIIKQIQSEQECVRRDRLTEYEERIYDQRRLISDKEVFTESLLRPKKQRPQNMTSEQFQEVRGVQKIQEEKVKILALEEEVKNLVMFRKKFEGSPKKWKGDSNVMLLKEKMQIYEKMKTDDLQKTNANSIDTVNTSNMNNVCEKPEKPFDEEEFNGEIPTNSQKQVNMAQNDCSKEESSQVEKGKQCLSGNYSIQIQRLIQGFQKKASQQEIKDKYKRISDLLKKIKQKKTQNLTKSKELKQLQKQNTHMKTHLKKTRQLYVQARSTHESFPKSQ